MSFADDLAAAQAVEVPFLDVDVLVNGQVHTLRFRRMDAFEWAAETDRHPARPGVLVDKGFGYNIRTLTKEAAKQSGVRLDGDTEVELRVDPIVKGSRTPRVDEWEQLFKAISGNEFARITDVIWYLNERGPQMAVEEAKKARAASAESSA